MQQLNNQFLTIEGITQTGIKWAPRFIIGGLAGYYSLGVAYDVGLMAAIDRIAIDTLKHFLGYAGIGAFMPTVQWYAAWSVRIVSALIAGLLYDLTLKVCLTTGRFFSEKWNTFFKLQTV